METIIVIEYGAQTSQGIVRSLREHGQFALVKSGRTASSDIVAANPIALVVTGATNAPHPLDNALLETAVPVLAVGNAAEHVMASFDGKNSFAPHEDDANLFVHHSKPVMIFQGNRSAGLPPVVATALLDRAKSSRDWHSDVMVDTLITNIQRNVGDKRVMLAISGGVDSTTLGVLLHRAIGDQLVGVFVDHGLLRYQELEHVSVMLKELGLQLEVVNAREEFFSALANVSDPEQKRKIIGTKFIDVFTNTAERAQGTYGDVTFLAQGTLYSDVVESESFDGSVSIKSHHNVGGLPEQLGFELLEPFRELFKDEVRAIAAELGLPEHIRDRHPFPGPGLAIRIIGDITPEKVDILQRVDHIFVSKLREHDLYQATWQALAVLTPLRSVGVHNNQRTYGYTVALRAVSSVDAMTATWTHLPHDFLAEVSETITNEVAEVTRVVFDITSKPPATIEWE